MSGCVVEAKRDYFGPSASISTPSRSPSACSPVLIGARDLSHRQSQSQSDNGDAEFHLHSLADGIAHKRMAPELAQTQTRQPPIRVDAIYEQPMAKAVPQLAAAARQSPHLSKLSTFKFPQAAAANSNQMRRSSGCNSLESLESKLSSSSATNELHEDEARSQNVHSNNSPNNGHRRSEKSVGVATRPVCPPEVPATWSDMRIVAAKEEEQEERGQSDSWRSIPLDDDDGLERCQSRRGKVLPCPSERGLTSIMLAKLKGHSSQQRQVYQCNKTDQHRSSSIAVPARKDLRLSVDANGGKQYAKSVGSPADSKLNDKLASGSNSSDSPWANFEEPRRKSSAGSAGSPGKQNRQIGKREPPFLFAGILGSILGSVFFSMSVLTIKLLPDGEGFAERTQIACWRGATMMALCTASMLKSGTSFLVPRDEIFINVLRSIFGFMGIYMSYIALKYISMGDATALIFSSPVWTSLLSHYILHEPLQWIQLLALPLSLIGIILIAHPSLLINMEQKAGPLERQPVLDINDVVSDLPAGEAPDVSTDNQTSLSQKLASVFGGAVSSNRTITLAAELNQDLDIAMNASEHFDYEHRWKGIVVALGCSLIISLVYIVLKFRKSTPIQTSTFWLAVANLVGSLIIGMFIGLGEFPSKLSEVALLLLNGVCSWFGQNLLQWALGYEDASVLSVVRTLDVAMSFTLSAIFLHEEILWTSLLGASIIAGVVISIMLSNYIQSRLFSPKANGNDLHHAPTRFSMSSGAASEFDEFNKSLAKIQLKQAIQAFDQKSEKDARSRSSLERQSTKIATVGA